MPIFSTQNQPTKRRTKDLHSRVLLLKCIKKQFGSEEEFYDHIIEVGRSDPAVLKWLFDRIIPPIKPCSQIVKFTLPKGDITKQAKSILTAVSQGLLAPDIGQSLLSSLISVGKIQEMENLESRLIELEDLINK